MLTTPRSLPARAAWRYFAVAAAGAALIAAEALDELGRLLLSAHMAQHLLLTMIAPLALVLARPTILLRSVLPLRWRAAAARGARLTGVAAASRFACRPLVAWTLLCGSFVLWHLPGPYQFVLQHDALRGLVAASFVAAGVAFWTAVTVRARVRPLGHGFALLLVVTAAVISGLPGALMTFAPHLLYPVSADTAALCGLTPLEDQQLAGLLMWIPMDAIFFAVAACLFVAWLRQDEWRVTLPDGRAARLSSLLLLALLLTGCDEQAGSANASNTVGDARRGAALIRQYGCGACHVIPGIAEAQGLVGPPLTMMGRRTYIVGILRNSPENMMAWLQNPQRIAPGNAMPNMGIDATDARDLTAYLNTLH
jgi:cytochrome c oxidase assembly factor CtaG/cytochrome c2